MKNMEDRKYGRFDVNNEFSPLIPISLGDGVITTGVKGVAAGNTFDRHPPPFEQAIFFDSLVTIVRTGGLKAASWRRVTRDKSLIEANEQQGDLFHNLGSTFFLPR
jgi:hypothetical protein